MNALFGLIDSLEATILEGKKIPLTDKVVLEEKKVLSLIDKMRLTLKSNGDIVRESIDHKASPPVEPVEEEKEEAKLVVAAEDVEMEQIREEAEALANSIKHGAEEYADSVLANLLLLITKLQKNLMTMERNIENGRGVLAKVKTDDEQEKVTHDSNG